GGWGQLGVPRPQRRIAHPHGLAGRFERIPLFDYQPHRILLKLITVRGPLSLGLFVHLSDLLGEPLFRLPPLSESRELSHSQATYMAICIGFDQPNIVI